MRPINLICFPFAGGNRYSYREYELKAPAFLKIIPLDYPGRGARMKDPVITDMTALVEDLYEQVKDVVNKGSYAFYGHSMGGVVALFLIRKLRASGHELPCHLFITSTTAPSALGNEGKNRYLMSKPDFIDELKRLDGCPDEILQNDDLLNYFEPILRADFQVSEAYTYTEEAPVEVPMTVITGTEEDMKEEDIRLWQKESVFPVAFSKLPGKHFFIFHHAAEVLAHLTKNIQHSLKQISYE